MCSGPSTRFLIESSSSKKGLGLVTFVRDIGERTARLCIVSRVSSCSGPRALRAARERVSAGASFLILSLAHQGPPQRVLRDDGLDVLGAEVGPPQLDGPGRVLLRLWILSESR